jgi:coenzyme F420-reducing hydrogenase alpha subunit
VKGDEGFSLHEGNVVSNKGLDMKEVDYQKHLNEKIVNYSTAKFAVAEGKEYMTGALARVNNNFEKLSDDVKKLAKGVEFPSNNPFHNNFAQALETLHWADEAIRIIEENEFRHEDPVHVETREGHGVAVIEVPRGMLFHDYELDSEGYVKKANIITPTVQNLANLNRDIKAYVEFLLSKRKISKDKLVLEIEKMIRAYDPCFSCSTHFLRVNWL